MTDVPWLDEESLDINDGSHLRWVRVQDAVGLIWRDNPKRHDMQQLAASVARYGYQDKPKFDVHLHRAGQAVDDEPLGAIKSGNGRVEAVAWLEAQGRELPRGCAVVRETGEWALQIDFGTDAKSGAVAQAYAIDANNLTLSGGDFDGFDMARLYGAEYVKLLEGMDELPVTVDPDLLAVLMMPYEPLEEIDEGDFANSVPDEDEGDGADGFHHTCPKCGYEWVERP